jgi:NAD/NADP transhydrogenase alpha subunit
MDFQISISGFVAVYIFMLAAFAGWVIIGRVPAILHTPLMSGSNFVHGIVVVGMRSVPAMQRAAMPSPTACSRCSRPAGTLRGTAHIARPVR